MPTTSSPATLRDTTNAFLACDLNPPSTNKVNSKKVTTPKATTLTGTPKAATPRSALKGTPASRASSRSVAFEALEDVLVEPERRTPFKYPTPEANRKVVRSIKGNFLKMSTAASPMGELTFGIVDIFNLTGATEMAEGATEEKSESRSPMPPNGRTNTHFKFNADGTTEAVVRRSSWIASAPTASFASDSPNEPALTLWHEMETPEHSTQWTAEEWAEWEADEWNAWEETQAEEWGEWDEEEWAAWEAWEAWDGAGEVSSPSAAAISTPDSSRIIKVLGKVGRMQRERGPTPEAHKAEGRAAALETLELIQKGRAKDAADAMAELSVPTPKRFKVHLAKTPTSAKRSTRSNKKATPMAP